MRLVLASASPARLTTLTAAGLPVEVVVSDVDETIYTADTHEQLVQVLARAKAEAVAGRLRDDDVLVLGCDSMLSLDGELLGKPGTDDAAAARWSAMRGRTGRLLTGHHLIDRSSGRTAARTVATTVHFADVTDDEVAAYAASGEPAWVAGAFTLDGLGGWFVEGVEGDPHNVVGVSLPVVRQLLRELGHGLTALGYPARR